MRVSFISLFLLLFFVVVGKLIAGNSSDYGNIYTQTISIEEGLSNSNVNKIIRDKEGFFWIATDDGLCRYDGYNIKVFKNIKEDSTSISGNHIYTVFEDTKGRLWVGTFSSGLNLYDKKSGRFKRYIHNENIPTSISHEWLYSIIYMI